MKRKLFSFFVLLAITAAVTGPARGQTALKGHFTINANGDKVVFSSGNLQATYNGSAWSWGFAAHQWDYIGNAAGNTNVTGEEPWISAPGTVDLFGWSTAATYFGIHNSQDGNTFSGDFVDWGTNIGTGWRTLSKGEWQYLLNTRTASTIGSTTNARFAKAYLFGTTHGAILFPDSYTHPTDVASPTGINDISNTALWNDNTYSAEDWAKMEAAGAVFLPAAGLRYFYSGELTNFNWIGYYQSSSLGTDGNAYNPYTMAVAWDNMGNDYYNSRADRFSVRLVKTVPVRSLTGIPQDWSVTADGQSVTVTNGTAEVPAGAAVKLIPPTEVKPTVKAVTVSEVTQDANLEWNFTMPDYDAVVGVTYKENPGLAWTYGGNAIPNDTTLTAYYGFHADTIQKIGITMSPEFNQAYTAANSTLTLRFGSTDANIVSFTDANNMQSFSVNGPGECDVYMVFDGNKDFIYDSVAFHINIQAPANLTLTTNNSNWGSVTLNSGNTLPEGVIAGVTEGTFHVIPGTQVTLNATANQGFHLKGWRYGTDNSCGGCWLSNNQPENPLQLTVTSDTNITAVFDTTKAELAWSDDEFTGYTMIDFNNYKPTLNNPHNVEVRYGLVENIISIVVNPETGYITNGMNVPRVLTSGTFHIYAVHETDQTYYYDSVVYTLTVNWGSLVAISQYVEEGGITAFLNAEDDLTHAYSISNNSKMALLAPGASFSIAATANEGYHFSKWQNGDNINGYIDYATTSTVVYTAPTEITSFYNTVLKAIFDTNTYALNVVVADGQSDRGTVAGSNTAAKHFLEYEISATPITYYHFLEWNDGNTHNPRTVSLVSDSTFTAYFAPDTFTITYMDGTEELKVEKVPYRESIPEYIPTKPGMKFMGWNPALPQLMPGENLTTYAQWACDSVLDIDENKYPAVNIGNKCWMAENLRTRHYADGREIAHIYEYHTTMNPSVPQNYGYLYDWYDAVDINRPATRATSSTYVQGVCPENYHIPTAEEVALLINLPANALCSTDGWITPDGITNSANFTAYPAGLYNAASARFEGRGTQTDWWIVNGTTSNIRDLQNVSSLQINYFCNAPQIITRNPNDAVSVRCVLND